MANPPVPSPYLEPAAIQVIRGRYGRFRSRKQSPACPFDASAIADNEDDVPGRSSGWFIPQGGDAI